MTCPSTPARNLTPSSTSLASAECEPDGAVVSQMEYEPLTGAITSKPLLVPTAAPSLAVMVTPLAWVVTATGPLHTPLTKLPVTTGEIVPVVSFRLASPVYQVATLPSASRAVMVMWNS